MVENKLGSPIKLKSKEVRAAPPAAASVRSTGETATKKVVSVKRAMEQALKLYNADKISAAAKLTAQIVNARPRLAEAHNLMGVIFARQGKKAAAVKAIGHATRLDPKNAQYLSNLGELERQRGKLHEAGIALRAAVEVNPQHPQALNNLGILHYDRKEFEEAIACYDKALAAAPNYAEAHNNLGNALRAIGRLDEAIDHYQSAVLIRENYPEAYNNMASVLLDKGQSAEAEHAYRKAIALRKDYIDAYVNLAAMLDRNDRGDEALRALGEALKINSKHAATLMQVARTQLRKANYDQAEQAARLALQAEPDSAEAHSILAQVLHETDRLHDAIGEFEAALALKPTMIDASSMYGVCLKSVGRLEEAKRQLLKTLELAPNAFGVYANLADLEKFTPDNPQFKAMESIFAKAEDSATDLYLPLHFAIGKAYDDVGEFEKAFQHFKVGATLKRAKLKYDESQAFAFFDSIREVFNAEFFAKKPFEGRSSSVPVFIIGMPRSGSTLVEQVLSNHPETFGAGEIKEFSRQLNSLRGRFPGLPRYPHIAQRMNAAQYGLVADGYLSKITALAPKAARITDKLLTNYYFVGILHTMFPNARFIHTKRNPVDTCLSAYTKLFKDDMPHSYDLGELGRYYRKYEELMAHWNAVLPPGVIKTIVYEEVVSDLPKMARELIDFVELPWNESCLNFHESDRPVRTASVVQVRKPVYSSSVGRFRRYGKELKPLIDALGYEE